MLPENHRQNINTMAERDSCVGVQLFQATYMQNPSAVQGSTLIPIQILFLILKGFCAAKHVAEPGVIHGMANVSFHSY